MKIFCINNKSLKFDLVGLSKKTYAKMKKIILENGGEVEHDDRQPIKFTEDLKYVTYAFPAYMLYNIKFILDCVKYNAIVNPSLYRIGTPLLADDFLMHHFFNGQCDHCATESTNQLVKMEPPDSMENEEHFSEVENDENDVNALQLKTSQRVLSPSQEANVNGEDFDQNNEKLENRSNGINSECNSMPLLQPKKNNISLAEKNNVTTSEAVNSSSHVVAGISSRKRRVGNFEFISDSNDEDNIPEDQENHIDDDPLESPSTSDDEAPKKRAIESKNQHFLIPQVKIEVGRKRGRGPRITLMEDTQIVKYLAENDLIGQVGTGLRVWEEVINSGICKDRTANSLYKHFYKTILPKIRTFNLTETQLKRFERLSKRNFH